MRIIGGTYGGYRFTPPKKTPARPTTDIAKEGLFNILNNAFYFEDVRFLDLFGGTGSISYEFASRGCTDITLVEKDTGNIRFIHKTFEVLNTDFEPNILQMDVFNYISHCEQNYDVIFAGPPYALQKLNSIPDLIFEHKLLAPEGWLILEHNPNHHFDEHPRFLRKRNYGSTIFSIFEGEDND